jgi:hypothetical protein
MISEILKEPLTFNEAYLDPDWKEAIFKEADSLKETNLDNCR